MIYYKNTTGVNIRMGPHELKLVDTTVSFLQYLSSILLIILSATGAAFYYYYTKKLNNNLKLKHLWPFAIPAAIVVLAFCFIGYLYFELINGLGEGSISDYVHFWSKYVGYIFWGSIFISMLTLVIAFIVVHRKP